MRHMQTSLCSASVKGRLKLTNQSRVGQQPHAPGPTRSAVTFALKVARCRGLTQRRARGDYKDPGPRTPHADQATTKRTPADYPTS